MKNKLIGFILVGLCAVAFILVTSDAEAKRKCTVDDCGGLSTAIPVISITPSATSIDQGSSCQSVECGKPKEKAAIPNTITPVPPTEINVDGFSCQSIQCNTPPNKKYTFPSTNTPTP